MTTAIIAALAAVAQIIGTAHAVWPKQSRPLKEAAKRHLQHLEDEIHATIRDVERAERLLRRAQSLDGAPVFDAPSKFGSVPMLLNMQEFQDFDTTVELIALRIGSLNKMTLGVIRYDPDFAGRIGADILTSFADIRDRINALRTASFGEAIYGSLEILRELERIIIRIRAEN